MSEHVILVNAFDEAIGTAEKHDAHLRPRLHRAFSVFVFNRAGELLLQQRAADKYHSGGLWTNTCCGHPRPGEDTAAAARRRLQEEMGFVCDLEAGPRFLYRVAIDARITEHELDHVFIGYYDGVPAPDPVEVRAWRWAGLRGITRELRAAPADFTAWFEPAFRLARPLSRPRARSGNPRDSKTPARR